MLEITIEPGEMYNQETNEFFFPMPAKTLTLEHSLVSISKWESTWCKPFLTKTDKTFEESIDYIRCMTLTQNVDPDIYKFIDGSAMDKIRKYIEAPMTATTFTKNDSKVTNREIVTSEIIYYWMIAFNIPVEFQKWHLNRLLTLINVCNIKNQPQKKMGRKDQFARQRALNAARRQSLNTTG